jgi:hypothetical protein
MADWCRYCSGFYPRFYCDLDNHNVLKKEAEDHCMINAYRCEIYRKYGPYYVTGFVCEVLNKPLTDRVYNNIRTLRDYYMQGNKKYENALKEYDLIGPALTEKMAKDENNKEIATKVYSVLEKITTLVIKQEIDKAVNDYTRLVKVLAGKYDINSEKCTKNNVKTLKLLDK